MAIPLREKAAAPYTPVGLDNPEGRVSIVDANHIATGAVEILRGVVGKGVPIGSRIRIREDFRSGLPFGGNARHGVADTLGSSVAILGRSGRLIL
nr:unnamed protein product [Digitaria exilis]